MENQTFEAFYDAVIKDTAKFWTYEERPDQFLERRKDPLRRIVEPKKN